MENVTAILPINSSKNKGFQELFKGCITSIQNQSSQIGELIIVHSIEDDLINFLIDYDFGDLKYRLVKNEGDTDFASQVNLGVKESKTEWISIIEFDDEYASIWFKNVQTYVDAYPDVNGFLPLVVDVDSKGIFAGFTNEAVFAANMNTDIGYLSSEVLLNYQNFQSSGMVIRKDSFEKVGGLKKNMKLTFVYEFLLRLSHNSVKIMTIPRIGYKHTNMREGSIFWNYKHGENKLSNDEVSFWLESAKKEYFFNEDRDIKFETVNG
jgi:GT2 family glycosyltransferase